MRYTDSVIEALTDAMAGGAGIGTTPREMYIYRESLLALVRLAKAEQLLEMREDFDALTLAPRRSVDQAQMSATLARIRHGGRQV